ncbi:MAG: DUF6465 family protein [Eubacteriales bacterium]|nr:DUF6465 family protein [Eubacteriales bacterium]
MARKSVKAKTVKTNAAVKTVAEPKEVKAAVKAEEVTIEAAKKEEVKEEIKAEAVKTAEVKTEEPKAEVKAEEKKAPRKTAAKKAVKETVYVQYCGKEFDTAEMKKLVKEACTKEHKMKVGDIQSMTLYVKTEEDAVYYVVNDTVSGRIQL